MEGRELACWILKFKSCVRPVFKYIGFPNKIKKTYKNAVSPSLCVSLRFGQTAGI